ncbi:hypothetical protein [Noviherbaspirillum sp.]|uniref:hypothetical protein n=1 Tax=Noviherbaspirillum sp. TaxID=1926288 RepID=UPI002B49327D|nr:hypothetical protein [Noviherbaspirillum sp.]HJV79365.1 hypothetical protein [Noviherbaspirillum sp.]
MSRISSCAVEPGTGTAADIYVQAKKIADRRVAKTLAALGGIASASLAALLNAAGASASAAWATSRASIRCTTPATC